MAPATSLQGVVEGTMDDQVFWQDLRAQFELLDPAHHFTAMVTDPGPWWLSSRDRAFNSESVVNRFRS
jgi:hypothetical protein